MRCLKQGYVMIRIVIDKMQYIWKSDFHKYRYKCSVNIAFTYNFFVILFINMNIYISILKYSFMAIKHGKCKLY